MTVVPAEHHGCGSYGKSWLWFLRNIMFVVPAEIMVVVTAEHRGCGYCRSWL